MEHPRLPIENGEGTIDMLEYPPFSSMFQQPRLMTPEDIHVLQTSRLSTPTTMEPPSLNYGWAPITQSRAAVSFSWTVAESTIAKLA